MRPVATMPNLRMSQTSNRNIPKKTFANINANTLLEVREVFNQRNNKARIVTGFEYCASSSIIASFAFPS